jgi:hypothetical protein
MAQMEGKILDAVHEKYFLLLSCLLLTAKEKQEHFMESE